jgi:hypothetical protein
MHLRLGGQNSKVSDRLGGPCDQPMAATMPSNKHTWLAVCLISVAGPHIFSCVPPVRECLAHIVCAPRILSQDPLLSPVRESVGAHSVGPTYSQDPCYSPNIRLPRGVRATRLYKLTLENHLLSSPLGMPAAQLQTMNSTWWSRGAHRFVIDSTESFLIQRGDFVAPACTILLQMQGRQGLGFMLSTAETKPCWWSNMSLVAC